MTEQVGILTEEMSATFRTPLPRDRVIKQGSKMTAGSHVERKRRHNLTVFAYLWLSGPQNEVIRPPVRA